ncbi:hypothetical protein [Pseudomonas sp. MWU13-2105]|uniref:hypothetical protein n=1 Tax=Pseudomonas sp. MWU13-2105 TaxID=2935074 RepID=UPI00399BA31C
MSLLVTKQNFNIALDCAQYAFVLENCRVVDEGFCRVFEASNMGSLESITH